MVEVLHAQCVEHKPKPRVVTWKNMDEHSTYVHVVMKLAAAICS